MGFSFFRRLVLLLQNSVNRIPFLASLENSILRDYLIEYKKPIFIVGVPRTGSTLLYQLMLTHSRFAYISNLAAFCYTFPVLATGLAERYLWRLRRISFQSTFGYTKGLLSPSEAGLLIMRWFGSDMTQVGTSSEGVKFAKKAMARISEIMGGPLLLKNLRLSLKIGDIHKSFPDALFIHVSRDPCFVAQSLLLSRRALGGEHAWFGFPIPGMESLRRQNVIAEIVGQVRTISDAIGTGKMIVPSGQVVEISYEEMCVSPDGCLGRIDDMLKENGIVLQKTRTPPPKLDKGNKICLDRSEWRKMKAEVENCGLK